MLLNNLEHLFTNTEKTEIQGLEEVVVVLRLVEALWYEEKLMLCYVVRGKEPGGAYLFYVTKVCYFVRLS